MMVSATTNEKPAPFSEEQQALAAKLAGTWKKQLRIAVLAVMAGSVLLGVLLAAIPPLRAFAVTVPRKFAQPLTKGMVLSIAWKMLFPAGIALLIAAIAIRKRFVRAITEEELLQQTPAAEVFRKPRRSSAAVTAFAAAAVLVCCFVLLMSFGYAIFTNRRRISLNCTAHNVRLAIVSWQQDCWDKQGIQCNLPADTGNLRGDDTDPDSLAQKIYPYCTDIAAIKFFRVLSNEHGSVTDVLISQSPITETSKPDKDEQYRLLDSFFTDELAVGSALLYDPGEDD